MPLPENAADASAFRKLGFKTTLANGNVVYSDATTLMSASGDPLAMNCRVLARVASSAASGNPAIAKNASGVLSGFSGQNTTGSVVWLQIYNKATAPVLGTDTPTYSYPIGANVIFDRTLPGGVLEFTTGIAFALTTDVAGATGTAAGAIAGFMILGV